MKSRSIIVNYLGGLGNRLFQLAAGIALAKQFDGQLFAVDPDDTVSADLRLLIGDGPPPPNRATLFRLGLVPPGSRPVVELGVRAARTLGWARERRLASGGAFELPPYGTPASGPLAIVGYAQHPGFFASGVSDVVERILANAEPELRGSMDPPRGPLISLRRGDYVQRGWELDMAYYRAGLEKLAEFGVALDGAIEVVGDDRLACMGLVAELRGDVRALRVFDPECQGASRAIADFWRTACASAVVMSNSTFCWWATVVGDALRPGRTVVFPANWLGGDSRVLHRSPWIALYA